MLTPLVIGWMIGAAMGWARGRGVTVREARKALTALHAQHVRGH